MYFVGLFCIVGFEQQMGRKNFHKAIGPPTARSESEIAPNTRENGGDDVPDDPDCDQRQHEH